MIELDKEDTSDYCGFLCGPETEKQQEIVDNIKELKKVNPEFAEEFKQRMIDLLKAV
jgi:hypothetical protein